MELKNSLLDKVKNENTLHSTTQNEFNEIKSIIPKLNKDNQYWNLYNEINKLIENGSFDDLQKASSLLEEKNYTFNFSFKKSTQTILVPNEKNSHQENLRFYNYLKKELFYQNNYQKVKQHFDLHNKMNNLSNSLDRFKNSESNNDMPTFNSLGFALGYPIVAFIVYIGFLALSGNNVNSILNMILVFVLLGGIIYGIYSLYHIFFTKDGWNSISEFSTFKKNKKEYERLKPKLNHLKREINTVANN